MSQSVAAIIVNSFLKTFPGADDVQITFKRTQQEAFGPQGSIAKIGRVKAAYDPDENRLILIGSHIRDARDLRETLQHELFVHKGLGLFEAKDQKELVDRIIDAKESDKRLKDIWSEISKR